MAGIGALINAAVLGVGAGLRGQNRGDDVNYERQRQARRDKIEEQLALLRQYAEQRAAERDRAYTDYLERGRQTRPPWEAAGFPDEESYLAFKQREAAITGRDHNIDPLSPEGIAAAEERERRLSRIPRRPGGPGGADGGAGSTSLGPLERTIDDLDREAARAERDVPVPWNPLMVADSAAYTQSREGAVARADSLRKRRDRFGQVRENIVGQLFGVDGQPAAPPEPAPATGAPAPWHPPMALPPAGAPGASQPAEGGKDPRIAELERQYGEAVRWRGPNGERKDPAALRARFQEALQQILAEGGGQ